MHSPKIHSILAALDLAERPEQDEVLRTAAGLALHLSAKLHVLHAVEYGSEEPPLPAHLRREVETAERALGEHVQQALPPGLEPASRMVVVGPVHRAIVDRAKQLAADLIVLSTHRGGGVRAHFIGTTADRVIRTSGVLCWIVRRPLALPLQRIGVPTDFSETARRALDLALAWAEMLGGRGETPGGAPLEIQLLYQEWSVTLEGYPTLEERELLPRLQREIEEARERAGGTIHALVRPVVISGVDPGTVITRYAEMHQLQLIIMGTHGRGGIRRTLIGSVASSVTRQAPCSVVLVPPSEEMAP